MKKIFLLIILITIITICYVVYKKSVVTDFELTKVELFNKLRQANNSTEEYEAFRCFLRKGSDTQKIRYSLTFYNEYNEKVSIHFDINRVRFIEFFLWHGDKYNKDDCYKHTVIDSNNIPILMLE